MHTLQAIWAGSAQWVHVCAAWLPGEGRHPASSRGMSLRKEGLAEDEPKQSEVWLRKVSSKMRGQITSLVMATPMVQFFPKRRRRAWGWREAVVFALSLMVEKQPRDVYLSTCLGSPLCSARGRIATAETLHLKGDRQMSIRKEDSVGVSPHLKWKPCPCEEWLPRFYRKPE